MGTRADFYVGKHKDAEWLGSIAWDGYREGIDTAVLSAKTEAEFREAVTAFLASRDDSTLPKDGWPWPWDNSGTSDCSYWFFDEQVWDYHGYPTGRYWSCSEPEPDLDGEDPPSEDGHDVIDYPDMSSRSNFTLGKRSGLIIVSR